MAAAVFWTAFFVAWSLAEHAGFGAIGWAVLVIYLFFAAPGIALQLLLIGDLLAFVTLGKIFAYPMLMRLVDEFSKAHPALMKNPPPMTATSLLYDVSPLSCFAIWSLVVLRRLPISAHGEGPSVSVRSFKITERRLEQVAYSSARQRLLVS